MAHVADGVKVDEEADASDDQHHDARKRIEQIAPVGGEAHQMPGAQLHLARCEPFEKNVLRDAVLRVGGQQLGDCACCEGEGQAHAADAKYAHGGVGKTPADKKHQRRRHQRKQRDEPQMLEEVARRRHAICFPCMIRCVIFLREPTTSANPFRLQEQFRGCGKTR